MRLKKGKKICLIAALLLLLLAVICGIYVGDYYRMTESAAAALASDEDVTVSYDHHQTVFLPDEAKAGFIFYPGGKVEYTAYSMLLRELAENGVLCVAVKMPGNLAVFAPNAADGISEQFPEIEHWYIGGHSLGGAMAASYAAKNADALEGLALLAAYSTADLTGSGLEVISLYGSENRVLNMEKYEEYRTNLPENAVEVVIDGGCHAYFGCYGAQAGDGLPTITKEEQIAITAENLLDMMNMA